MRRFQLSFRRRIALVWVAMFIAGYILIRVAISAGYNLSRSFGSGFYSCQAAGTPALCPAPYDPVARDIVLGALIVGPVVVVLLSWLLMRWLTRPLAQMARVVRQVGPQSPGQRVKMTGPSDELRELADAVDAAMDRLAAGYEGQRRFAANAAHELRTPLAVQRTLVEVAIDDEEAGDGIRRLAKQLLLTNERNEQLIEGLVILAESDRGLVGSVPVALDRAVSCALDAHAELFAQRELTVEQHVPPRVVAGDPVLLDRLVHNLVQNAASYNRPGGWIRVNVADEPALCVHNSGPEVPAEIVPGLFEPFRRVAADRMMHRKGAGLGLSIVASITRAHGGTVRAAPGESGGLIVEVFLP